MNQIIFELPELMPLIIAPLIIGWLFLFPFLVASLRLDFAGKGTSWIVSYIIGYLFHMALDAIHQSCFEDSLAFWIIATFAVLITGYLIGKMIRSRWFNDFLYKIGVREALSPDYWTEVIDYEKGTYLIAHLLNDSKIIEGVIYYVESSCSNPHVMIHKCKIKEKDNVGNWNTIDDMSEDERFSISINTSKCDYIELGHYIDSRVFAGKKKENNLK